eukprot:2398290-Amphidinium_carterae.2
MSKDNAWKNWVFGPGGNRKPRIEQGKLIIIMMLTVRKDDDGDISALLKRALASMLLPALIGMKECYHVLHMFHWMPCRTRKRRDRLWMGVILQPTVYEDAPYVSEGNGKSHNDVAQSFGFGRLSVASLTLAPQANSCIISDQETTTVLAQQTPGSIGRHLNGGSLPQHTSTSVNHWLRFLRI